MSISLVVDYPLSIVPSVHGTSQETASTGLPLRSVTPLRSLAAVLPRYGANLGGGAETLTRELLLAIKERQICERIEVWTTCATDHRTWENTHSPGVTVEDGLRIHRFPVDDRNLEVFIGAELGIAAGRPLTADEQLGWLGAGVNSRGLYEHIVRERERTDAILFAPYLFPTSFWGPLLAPDRSILIPCLHNEPYAYLSVFRPVFRSVRGCLFNAEPEQALATAIFSDAGLQEKSGVVGMGFRCAPPHREPPNRGGTLRTVPYLLYSGRKERGKNLDLLIRWFASCRSVLPTLELVLIGSGSVDFLAELPDGIVDLGFVSEEEKLALMGNALALCQLSVNESFSIVMMEAWAQAVPVIVHANGAVPRHHVVRSGGGLYAGRPEEFLRVVERLFHDADLRRTLGAHGRRYVEREYSWDAVVERFRLALSKMGYRFADSDPDVRASGQLNGSN